MAYNILPKSSVVVHSSIVDYRKEMFKYPKALPYSFLSRDYS
jgi:hypothetical protein